MPALGQRPHLYAGDGHGGVGELYDIDAFNQPGVELSKKATYALMGGPGFEELATEIRSDVPEKTPYRIERK